MFPDALFCSATDANGPGDRFADRHQSLARKFGIPFERLRPLIEGGDWNEALRAQSSAIVCKPEETWMSEMISPTKAAAAADFDDAAAGRFCVFAQLRAPIVASIKRRSDRVGKLFVTLV
jgi:hypothetical protein